MTAFAPFNSSRLPISINPVDIGSIPRERLKLAQARTAAWFAGCGVALALIGVAAFLAKSVVGTETATTSLITLSVLGGSLLFVAAIIALCTLKWQRDVYRMAEEETTTCWTYQPQHWEQFIENESRRGRWAPWIVAGSIGLAGVIFLGILIGEEGRVNAVGGMLGGALIGGGIVAGLLTHHVLSSAQARRRFDGGLTLIGDRGVFISGAYWPWHTFGQHLEYARIDPPADTFPLSSLILTFRIETNEGSNSKDVHIPISPARDEEANAVLAFLMPDDDSDEI